MVTKLLLGCALIVEQLLSFVMLLSRSLLFILCSGYGVSSSSNGLILFLLIFGKYDFPFFASFKMVLFSLLKLKLNELPPCLILRIVSLEINFTPSSISSTDKGGLLGLAFQSGPPLLFWITLVSDLRGFTGTSLMLLFQRF